jgi:hypothetical protein
MLYPYWEILPIKKAASSGGQRENINDYNSSRHTQGENLIIKG